MASAKVGPAGGLVGPGGGLVGPAPDCDSAFQQDAFQNDAFQVCADVDSTNAPAGVATGTGAALSPSVAITVNAGVATGSGAALAPDMPANRARVTTMGVEVIYPGIPAARVTTMGVEVIYIVSGNARVTTMGVEVIVIPEAQGNLFRGAIL